jgi:hypothetical protein
MNLTELGTACGTDKVGHRYTPLYEGYLGHLRNEPITLMEIGVHLGYSLKMWEAYFTKGLICGVDNCTLISADQLKSMSVGRIKTFVADQAKRDQLQKAVQEIGQDFDIIVDDGYHYQEHQQISLAFLFPFLKKGGVYVVEDLCPKSYPGGGWGITDMKNFTDITTNVLEQFKTSRKITSLYMLPKEIEYLNSNIDKIEIHYINKDSIIAFIWKKQ